MSILKIYEFPDEILKRACQSIENINGDLLQLMDNMAETMYKAPGIGLAAPQVGQNIRMITLDTAAENEPSNLIILINPEITASEGEITAEEGCLSLPTMYSPVKRFERVQVKGVDEKGNDKVIEAEGLLSIVLQHEIDHLNGVLFIDRLNKLKRVLLLKKFYKKRGEASGNADRIKKSQL